jgi:hypothetical protein
MGLLLLYLAHLLQDNEADSDVDGGGRGGVERVSTTSFCAADVIPQNCLDTGFDISLDNSFDTGLDNSLDTGLEF